MERKQVLQLIAENYDKPMYLKYGDSSTISVHVPASKTALLKNAKHIHSVRVQRHGAERPDLDAERYSGMDVQIVTFDMTTTSRKTLEEVLKGK
jgi:hypothetical protein